MNTFDQDIFYPFMKKDKKELEAANSGSGSSSSLKGVDVGGSANKVPMIRLKLKVNPTTTVTGTGDSKEKDEEGVINPEPVTNEHYSSPSPPQTQSQAQSQSQAQIQIQSQPQSQVQSQVQSQIQSIGPFKYRPFKLFPLLPASSRYSVLIPAKYTADLASHPAVKRNYLWNRSGGLSCRVYTDDSDLVCILLRDGWCTEEQLRGSSAFIEVEVTTNDYEDEGKDILLPSSDSSSSIKSRKCEANHEGSLIRILS